MGVKVYHFTRVAPTSTDILRLNNVPGVYGVLIDGGRLSGSIRVSRCYPQSILARLLPNFLIIEDGVVLVRPLVSPPFMVGAADIPEKEKRAPN